MITGRAAAGLQMVDIYVCVVSGYPDGTERRRTVCCQMPWKFCVSIPNHAVWGHMLKVEYGDKPSSIASWAWARGKKMEGKGRGRGNTAFEKLRKWGRRSSGGRRDSGNTI